MSKPGKGLFGGLKFNQEKLGFEFEQNLITDKWKFKLAAKNKIQDGWQNKMAAETNFFLINLLVRFNLCCISKIILIGLKLAEMWVFQENLKWLPKFIDALQDPFVLHPILDLFGLPHVIQCQHLDYPHPPPPGWHTRHWDKNFRWRLIR